MNLKAKLVFSVGVLCLLSLVLPGSLRADTVYTYTGNAYTNCFGTYTCNGTTPAISFTFDTTLMGAQLDNLAIDTVGGGNLTAHVSSFSFTDGTGLLMTQSNSFGYLFDVTTNSSGDITKWYMTAFPPPGNGGPYGAGTCGNDADCGGTGDSSVTYSMGVPIGDGSVANDAGTWTVTTTPEPGTAGLMLLGIGLVLVIRSRMA
jgi:hypothetical protein